MKANLMSEAPPQTHGPLYPKGPHDHWPSLMNLQNPKQKVGSTGEGGCASRLRGNVGTLGGQLAGCRIIKKNLRAQGG